MSKAYIYHAKRPDFVGDRLYPLNTLKGRLPEVYAGAVKKYEGREWLLDVKVPVLNALWNDVIHFSLMHPYLICETLSDIGFEHHKYSREWFEVPVADVLKFPSIIYKNTRKDRSSRIFPESDFEPVREERVLELSGMPERNLAYYGECFADKTIPLIWGFAPHVLIKGELDISGYRTVNWMKK